MPAPKKLLEKISTMASELGGVNSYFVILEKDGETIATFEGEIEESLDNLIEGFDYFVTKLKEFGLPKEAIEELLQSLQEGQKESVSELFAAKNNLKLVK